VPRILQKNLSARIKKAAWPRPELFNWLQREGNVAEDEMYRVFNCGIGMVLVVDAADAKRAADLLRAEGETAYEIGKIEASSGEPTAVVD
jgi:phosphoribosylformylglycinamidine cyclo-ligase